MYWHYWFETVNDFLNVLLTRCLKVRSRTSHSVLDGQIMIGRLLHGQQWETFQANHMICEQKYLGDEDYVMHFNYCLKAFKDQIRYIKVDGKPFFLLYDAKALPNSHHFFDLWNKLAKQNGFPGIHFVGINEANDPDYSKVLGRGYDVFSHGGAGSYAKNKGLL